MKKKEADEVSIWHTGVKTRYVISPSSYNAETPPLFHLNFCLFSWGNYSWGNWILLMLALQLVEAERHKLLFCLNNIRSAGKLTGVDTTVSSVLIELNMLVMILIYLIYGEKW